MSGVWKVYNAAKKYLLDGTIDLADDQFRISLYTSASNAATLTLSAIGAVTNEVTEGLGYSSSGKPLQGVTWTQGASAAQMRFNAAPTRFPGPIVNIKYAVIWKVGASAANRKVLCYFQISATQFSVLPGSNLIVQPSAIGIFVLN